MAKKLARANYDAIRDHIFDCIHKTGEHAKNDFPNRFRTAIAGGSSTQFVDAEGKPFTNLVDWLHYTFPNGAGMGQGQHAISYEDALKLTEGRRTCIAFCESTHHGLPRSPRKQSSTTALIPNRSGAKDYACYSALSREAEVL